MAVGVLGGGLAVAALATGAGPFLRADRDFVGRPFQVPRPLRFGPDHGTEALPAGLRRASDVAEIVLVVLASLVVLAMVVALLTVFVRGLARVRLLRLRTADSGVPDAYDAGELAEDEGTEPLRRKLRRQLELGAEALDGAEAHEVVIACYLALLDAVAASGVPPRAHETPTELLERVLAERAVSPAAIGALTAVYREARYSSHVVDAGMRERARAALADARRELAA
ncbi:MAG TPA: DUF4129 domain-containing protein [Mycobacteriales bacterium]|nr:DUF4129 domain-containing protein [Mycobacteriales bacterium]